MSREIHNPLSHMPFSSLTDFELNKEFESIKNYMLSLMKENGFYSLVKENEFLNTMNSEDTLPCRYYDVDEFTALNINEKKYLNIFSLNISSLPKHGTELACYLHTLETTFDVIVLCEIGKKNLDSMKNLFKGYTPFF